MIKHFKSLPTWGKVLWLIAIAVIIARIIPAMVAWHFNHAH